MADSFALVVSLWIQPGQDAAFEAFERKAATIMARHGGQIAHAIRLAQAETQPTAPHEIHFVTFPDPAAYAAYRADPDTLSLAGERGSIVARSEAHAGRVAGPYP